MEFVSHTLDNGLQVVAERNDKAYSTAIAFFVNTGARDESAELSGVSHFLEHMAFKGTPTRSAAEINTHLDEIGAQSNAYTSEEQTAYYAAVCPEYQERVVEVLADMMRPALKEEDFELEKQVIVEEIHKYDDQPPFGANEKCMELYFGDHALGNNILGSVESVQALTPEAMKRYFEQRYSPTNIKLVATGKVDFDELVKQAERFCGDWQRFEATRNPIPAVGNADTHWIHRESATQQYAVMMSPGPAIADDDRYAARLMSVILGDDGSSRMFWAFVDTGLAEYATTATYEFHNAGILMTFIGCAPDRMLDNMEKVRQLHADLEANGVTNDELELSANKVSSQIVRRAERPLNRLFVVGTNWLQEEKYFSVQDSLDAYRSVTKSDIDALLQKYPISKFATVFAGPLKQA